jgi:TatD DNase family protein
MERDSLRLLDLLSEPKVLAVGECGLDFHYDHSSPETQIRVLREQWDLACELDLPVVVHNRDSDDQMTQLVREPEYSNLRGDFHSFSGNLEMAKELLERGFYLGVSGMVTFRNAENIREIVSVLRPSQYLVETDTPYLAPVPYRGKENRPAYVIEVAQRTAKEMGLEFDRLARQTNENFRRLFFLTGLLPSNPAD